MKIDWRHWFKKEHHGYDAHPTKIGKVWHFLAHEDSWVSFIVDAILVLVLGKFVVLPILSLALGTAFPLVAVVSSSMEHHGNFDSWWSEQGAWYVEHNITKEQFLAFPYKNGFNKGDAFVVKGAPLEDIEVGDVIIYLIPGRPDPIIHRVVDKKENALVSKGDANPAPMAFEYEIEQSQLQGKAIIRIPYMGWVKTAFVDLINALRR